MTESAEERRARVAEIARSFPEAAVTEVGQHMKFTVRKKTFAYYVNYPHRDDPISLCCKAAPGEASRLVASHPAGFFTPRYLGPKGWVGLRLDLSDVDWAEVERLLIDGYQLVAPRRLAALL